VSEHARHRFAGFHLHHQATEESGHELAHERAPRPIWLPQLAEPVTLVIGAHETLPARVTEREADLLVVAVVVPTATISDAAAQQLVLEYSNPGGRVRLSGSTTVEPTPEGAIVRIADPHLLEVVQERAHVRVEAHCPIVVTTDRLSEPLHTFTVDISAGGALLDDAEVVSTGEALEFELVLEAGERPVAGTAEVVRRDGKGRAGIEFTKLSQYDRWRLIHFTVERQSEEGFRHAAADEERA
jgi:hypothetical protein